MKNAIFTCSDAQYGDFLINHWLKSLKENVNLRNIDVIVLDYGLSEGQRAALCAQGLIVYECAKWGHVTNIRWSDMDRFLKEHPGQYRYVLSLDGGDIIFQSDVSHLFDGEITGYMGVYESKTPALFYTYLCAKGAFDKEVTPRILSRLRDRKIVNVGFLLTDPAGIEKLAVGIDVLMLDKSKFGPEQVAINFIISSETFTPLPEIYNYVLISHPMEYKVVNGVFRLLNDELIIIPHNAGEAKHLRPINNFGYENRNAVRTINRIKSVFLYEFLIPMGLSIYSLLDHIRYFKK
jgi:hypothetical protein